MTEFAICFAITLAVAIGGFVLMCTPAMFFSWRNSQANELYWRIHSPCNCPHCGAKYDVTDGRDRCITRFVSPNLDYWPALIEPFLGIREFHCSHCGTIAEYERKDGPAVLDRVTTLDDVHHARRCLECNDVFALPADGKCPVCGGSKLVLEAEVTR